MKNPSLKNHQFIFICIVMALLILPSLIFTFRPSNISNENRRLNRPPIPADFLTHTFFQKFRSHFNDHFGLRNEFLHAYYSMKIRIFSVKETDLAIIGKNKWIFNQIHINAYKKYRHDNIKHWKTKFKKADDYFKQNKISMIALIVPYKNSIYPEYLPNRLNSMPENNTYTEMNRFLNEKTSIIAPNLKNYFLDIKDKQDAFLYYQTDSHWSRMGAYRTFQLLLDRFLFPNSESHLEYFNKSYRIETIPGERVAKLINLENYFTDREIMFKFKWTKQIKTNRDKIVIKRTNLYNFFHSINKQGYPKKVVLVGDSYTNLIRKFFEEVFSETISLRYSHANLPLKIISSYKPDLVIYVVTENKFAFNQLTLWAPKK